MKTSQMWPEYDREAVVQMTRVWAMPNKDTFSIKPIADLLARYVRGGRWVDPFARNSPLKHLMLFTNDLSPEFDTTHHMEALDFLKSLQPQSFDGILYDPPYSYEQLTRAYSGVGKKATSKDTSAAWNSERKAVAASLLRVGGLAISFGWNTAGFGKKNGMVPVEYMAVCHGGDHYDTLVTVERKANQ